MLLFMRSAARGAHNIIHAAVEDKEKLVNGGFYRLVPIGKRNKGQLGSMSNMAAELVKRDRFSKNNNTNLRVPNLFS